MSAPGASEPSASVTTGSLVFAPLVGEAGAVSFAVSGGGAVFVGAAFRRPKLWSTTFEKV